MIECHTARRVTFRQCVHSQTQIDITIGATAAKQIAFAQQRRDSQRGRTKVQFSAAHDHVREAWMSSDASKRAPMRIDATVGVEYIERGKQITRLRKARCRWRVQPLQRVRISDSPCGEFERKRCEIGFENLSR
jgi:hypothetical protein